MKKLLASIAILILILGIVLPFTNDKEIYDTPADAKQYYPGSYIDLPSGKTFYRTRPARSGRGTPMIMVHGFTGNSFVWEPNLDSLSSRFDLHLYDLYGRGFSQRSDDFEYDMKTFQTQLEELVAHLGLDQFVLCGMSMGGAISLRYAAEHTEQVAGVILVDPAGFPFKAPAVTNLTKIPVLGEYLTALIFPIVLEQAYARGFYDDALADDFFRDRYGISAKIRGYRNAILQTARNMDLHNEVPSLKTLAAVSMPTLLVWGDADEVIPPSVFDDMVQVYPQARTLYLEETGHMASFEKPELFNDVVLRMWKEDLAGYGSAVTGD